MTYKQSEISDCIPTIGVVVGLSKAMNLFWPEYIQHSCIFFLIFIYLAESGLSWGRAGSFTVAHGP